jgi:hypothetical protein
MREEIKPGEADLRSIINTWITDIKDVHKGKTTASQEATEANTEKTEPDMGMMQSVAEHQEAPKEDAVVKPGKGRKKRRMGRKPAAGRRGEPKELTRSECGSGKKLTACRKVSSCATVALRKRNLLRKIGIQASCDSRRRLTVAGRKMTLVAAVAWRKRNVFREIRTKENCGPREEFAAAGIRATRCAKVAQGREHGMQRRGKTTLHLEPEKDERRKIDVLRARNANTA